MSDRDNATGGRAAHVPTGRSLRQRMVPVRYLLPNLFTLLSLCAGLTAIRCAIEGRSELGVALIVLAGLLDAVDGRVARAVDGQSRFGAELDSLADCVNFGVAPAILVYMWGLAGQRGLGWIAVLVFACSMSLRLARFNAALDDNKPRWQAAYFMGVPAPAGAILVLLPLYIEGAGLVAARNWPLLITLYVMAIASLLVSTIPTFSAKLVGERIAREHVAPALVVAALFAGVLVTYPFVTLTVATLTYLAVIPWSWLRFRTRIAEWRASEPVLPSGPGPAASQRTDQAPPPPGGSIRH